MNVKKPINEYSLDERRELLITLKHIRTQTYGVSDTDACPEFHKALLDYFIYVVGETIKVKEIINSYEARLAEKEEALGSLSKILLQPNNITADRMESVRKDIENAHLPFSWKC